MRRQRRGRRGVAIGLTALLAVASATNATAAAPSKPAQRALAACHRASLVGAKAAAAQLEEGVALAELAIDERTADPAAHFALFCTLAKQIRLRGIGITTLFDLARARAALRGSADSGAIAAAASLLEHLCERSWPHDVGVVLLAACPPQVLSVARRD